MAKIISFENGKKKRASSQADNLNNIPGNPPVLPVRLEKV